MSVVCGGGGCGCGGGEVADEIGVEYSRSAIRGSATTGLVQHENALARSGKGGK